MRENSLSTSAAPHVTCIADNLKCSSSSAEGRTCPSLQRILQHAWSSCITLILSLCSERLIELLRFQNSALSGFF